MVISHLLRGGFTNVANVIQRNAGNPAHKRLLVNKFESLLLLEKRFIGAYDGDGRTIGFIINKAGGEVLSLTGFTKEGFIVPNGSQFVGSLIIFPHSVINWNVLNASEVTEESLVLFKLLDPKIDILLFGYGSKNAYTPEVKANFQNICKKLQLRFEALPTENAVGVFNFLAEERRLVAAALIPPSDLSPLRHYEGTDSSLLEDFEDEEEEPILIDIKKKERKLIK